MEKKKSFTVNSPFMQLPTKPDFCKLIENISDIYQGMVLSL